MKINNILNCSVCGNLNKNFYIKKKIYNFFLKKKILFNIKICSKCSFAYQSSLVSKKKYNSYYKKFIDASAVSCNIGKTSNYDQSRFDYLKKILKIKNINNIKNILEIGGGDGSFLKFFKKKNVLNIEPSTHIAKFKVKTFNSTFDNFKEDKKYDLVNFFHTLEHIYNINSFIKKLKRISHNETIFFLEVPNSLSNKNFVNNFVFEHISYFNKCSLTFFLKKNNFKILHFYQNDEILRCIFKKTNLRLNINYLIKFNKKKKLQDFKYKKKEFKFVINLKKKIKEKIRRIIKKEKKFAVYGAGLHTLNLCYEGLLPIKNATFFIDKNKKKKNFIKKNVYHPSNPIMRRCKAIIISSLAYEKEIYLYLKNNFKNKNIYKLYN